MGEDSYIGAIGTFAGHYAPRNWMDCAGQTLEIKSHAALFSIIGTIYGGNGSTHFQLPDLRPEISGVKTDWAKVGMPRDCICIDGIYPMRD